MANEQKLAKQIEEFANIAKTDKNIDVSALMLNALQNQNKNLVSSKAKKWAYLISISLPPFGFLFALKYYFSDEDDARQVANLCITLTVISVIAYWVLGKMILTGSGTSLQQIQQIKPADIQQGLQ
jgi:hypothetical protein